MALHTRRQPFGESGQQPAQHEVDDRGDHKRLQDIEVHRTETTGFLKQIRVHDNRAERGVLQDDDQLSDRRRQHRVNGLRDFHLHQGLRAGQTEGKRRLMLPIRQVADAGAHKFGDHGTVVQYQAENDRPVRRILHSHEGEQTPEEDHHHEHRHSAAEFDNHRGDPTHGCRRQQTPDTEEDAECHGTDHRNERRLNGHPQTRQIEVGPGFCVQRRFPQIPCELVFTLGRVVQPHEDENEDNGEDDDRHHVGDADALAASRAGRVEQYRSVSVVIGCCVRHDGHLRTASLLDRYVVSAPNGIIRIT